MQNAREQMVEQQVRAWEVLDPAVLDAMQNISREEFLPEKLKNLANADANFNLRENFTLPNPSVQGKILQALQLLDNDNIYQIGAGSGYLTACLAFLGGHVSVAEGVEEVVQNLSELFQKMNIKNASITTNTWPEALRMNEKKFDAIVSQFAFSEVPESIKKGLTINGRAVLFIGKTPINECVVVERIGEEEWLEKSIFETQVSGFPQKTTAAFRF